MKNSVLRRALDTYGEQAQICMMFEEMSELQKELCKNIRGFSNRESIVEEIADVEIMLEQMKIMFNCYEDTERIKDQKAKRLADRIGQRKDNNLIPAEQVIEDMQYSTEIGECAKEYYAAHYSNK